MFHNLNATNTLTCLLTHKVSLINPRGLIMEIYFNPQTTKFNINDFIKLSKKTRRSEKLINKPKALLQYTLVGKLINYRKRGLNTSFTIRNSIDLCKFEMTYPLFTPIITQITAHGLFTKNKKAYKKANLNVINKKCCIPFHYVINEYKNIEKFYV